VISKASRAPFHRLDHRWRLCAGVSTFVARPRDAEDIRQLIGVLDLHKADDVPSTVREIFPEEEPPQRLRLLLEEIFTEKE
jgi:hypothetical protein